ncbi:CDP-glycerol glycerophosphotransferase family protein [Brevibacterium sp.]|uniref:bifunctional glycosyltransferase/CDP-glycerol:glycerophosphate glycerophosphotransferase n=1 Tax=Brevibacterium sp. TaxID=1701 RepID=UPI0028119597|nr:CDP-glycerol glycerophosphotransferase family protein [Brevibacterium sp.]
MVMNELVRTAARVTRSAADGLPAPARRRVHRALKSNLLKQVVHVATGSQRREVGPLVTIVVPVYNVAQYLPEFLDSVVGQTYKNLEILVVDDGSPDESAAIARRWGRWDRRIKVITKPNGGLGDARNAGLKAARGKYITFTDSDDILPPNGIRSMVETIEASGSDFVVGTMVRMRGGKKWLPQWTRRAHGANRIGITVDQFPEILLDVFACNKIWNTEFFREHVHGFPVGVAYEDQEPSVKSYLSATKFDIIKDHVYYWRIRDDGSSITQQKAKLTDLRDRIRVSLAVGEHMVETPLEAVRRGWYRKIFGVDLIQYVEQVPRTGEEYFEELCDGYEAIISLCEDDFWRDVATYPSVAAWYVLNRDYESLMEVIAGHVERGRGYRLHRDEGVLSAWPLYVDGLRAQPNDKVFETRDEYLDIVSKVTQVEWLDDSRVRIGGHAFVRSAFSPDENVNLSLSAVNTLTGERLEMPTRLVHDPAINEFAGTEARDCSTSGFEAVVDTSQLSFTTASDSTVEGEEFWKLVVSVQFEQIRKEDILREIADDAGAAQLGHSGVQEGEQVFALTHSQQEGLRFRLSRPKTVARAIVLQGRTLDISVKSLLGEEVSTLILRSKPGKTSIVTAPIRTDADGYTHFRVDVPPRDPKLEGTRRSKWIAGVTMADGSRRLIHFGSGSASEAGLRKGDASLTADFDARGYLRLDEWPNRFTTESITVNGDALVAQGCFLVEHSDHRPVLTLVGESLNCEPSEFDWDRATGSYSVRFPLSRTDWYGNEVALPLGAYALMGQVRNTEDSSCSRLQYAFIPLGSSLTMPWEGTTGLSRIRITRTRKAFRPWIKVMPLLGEDERGHYNRRAVIGEADASRGGLSDSILFESYHGKQISDSCRALYDWVREHRPDLKCLWSVNSHAVSVPPGAEAVLHGSRAWFRAAATSRYLVNNANFPGYFRIRGGQRYLQTWHGTPMKKIAEDMPPGNLSLGYRLLMRREAKAWDTLLAQNDFAADVLPKAFWFHGTTLNVGYPRNDVLVGEREELTRSLTRQRLGIADDSFVVMYAPTFRDNVKTTGGGYAFSTELDVEQLLLGLPSDSRVLVRGHANTTGSANLSDSDRVIDVSSYGEISELFAASDTLITDYSSMMFDYAVTRKPMFFFVPDLEEYESSTRGFYLDFREICPGPNHKDTRSLVVDLQHARVNPGTFIDSRYLDFVDRFAPNDDGHATQRLVENLQSRGWFA